MRKQDVPITCPRCKHRGFWQIVHREECCIFKPEFKCDSCDNYWVYGRDGGHYINATMGQKPCGCGEFNVNDALKYLFNKKKKHK